MLEGVGARWGAMGWRGRGWGQGWGGAQTVVTRLFQLYSLECGGHVLSSHYSGFGGHPPLLPVWGLQSRLFLRNAQQKSR